MLLPVDLKAWVAMHREELKPPVCNRLIFTSTDYIIMAVGGPNNRADFHINQTEEIFYQIEGDMVLNIIEQGKHKCIAIKEGEIYLLGANIPHSPQRYADTIGLVIEKIRQDHEQDGFQWYCQDCGEKMYEEFLAVHDIVNQLPEVFSRFYDHPTKSTCQRCGWTATRTEQKG